MASSFTEFLGTFLLVLYLPVPIYMAWIHAFHRLWKRLGAASFAIHLTFYVAMIAAIVRFHDVWRWQAWPWPSWVSWFGLPPITAAAWLAYRTYTTIPLRALLAFRQVRPNGDRRLVREGILGTIRHPRYVMFTLLAAGNFVITGYPLVLASLVLAALVFAAVIHMEESELREYFGEDFEEYRRTVPAFFPRVTKGRGKTA